MTRRLTAVLALATFVLPSCTTVATYGYQAKYEISSTGEEAEPANVEARQLLASAKTVAFFPPDRCVNTTDKAEQEKEFRANCGVLLSLLERAAERAGYEVVSWVNLRGSSRPIDYAREAKVDVLFEINEVAAEEIKDADAKRTLAFFDRSSSGIDQPLVVSGQVGERCRDWSAHHDPGVSLGRVATIDIKTVSVADGRVRWHYRKTNSQTNGVDPSKVRFVGKNEPSKTGGVLAGIGLAGVILGGVLITVDSAQSAMEDPVTGVPKDKIFGSASYYILAAGIVFLAGGTVLAVTQKKTKPSPESVLCLDTTIPADGLYDRPPATTTQYRGPDSQQTFNETHHDASAADEKAREKAIADIVPDFVRVLSEAKASKPPATPAPTPAPATP